MRRAVKTAVICVLSLSAAAVAWAAPPPAAKQKPAPHDNQLRTAILERFSRSKAAGEHFQVAVQGTTAIITGKTDVVQRKASATRMAKAAGAKEVINKIQVSAAGKAKASEGLRRAGLRRSDTQARSDRTDKR